MLGILDGDLLGTLLSKTDGFLDRHSVGWEVRQLEEVGLEVRITILAWTVGGTVGLKLRAAVGQTVVGEKDGYSIVSSVGCGVRSLVRLVVGLAVRSAISQTVSETDGFSDRHSVGWEVRPLVGLAVGLLMFGETLGWKHGQSCCWLGSW